MNGPWLRSRCRQRLDHPFGVRSEHRWLTEVERHELDREPAGHLAQRRELVGRDGASRATSDHSFDLCLEGLPTQNDRVRVAPGAVPVVVARNGGLTPLTLLQLDRCEVTGQPLFQRADPLPHLVALSLSGLIRVHGAAIEYPSVRSTGWELFGSVVTRAPRGRFEKSTLTRASVDCGPVTLAGGAAAARASKIA